MSHIPEPWRVTDGPFGPQVRGTAEILQSDVVALANTANAVRIVACANACKGIPTAALENGAVADLLDACRAALSVLSTYIHPDQFDGHASRALVLVRDAVKKATGKETP